MRTPFDRYLTEHDVSLEAAAAALRVSEGWVRQLRKGTMTPSKKLARRIVEWSGGKLLLIELLDPPLVGTDAATSIPVGGEAA